MREGHIIRRTRHGSPTGHCLGAYEIIAFIGAGGMGEVYKARDTRLDRTVAVKVLGRDVPANGSFRTRFTREARTLSHLEHPHICALYDVGRERPRGPRGAGGERDDPATSNAGIEEEIYFLVMQYLEGSTSTR
jgi:serine/threonine protein kinase